MARTSVSRPAVQIDAETAMTAILAVLVADREDRLYATDTKHEPARTEIVLSMAGLDNSQIAALVGRTKDSVQKTVKRGRS